MRLLIGFLFFLQVLCGSYYDDLGLQKNSDDKEIRKAYRKLSLQYHPDKNPDARDKYLAVNEDPEMRKIYDTKGKEGVDKFKAEKNAPKQQNPFGMFGFQQSDTPRGPDFEVDLEVTLRDLYEGRQFSLTQRKQNTCSQCRGTGARSEADIHTCPKCKGKGVVTRLVNFMPGMQMQQQETCGACGGRGKTVKVACPHCRGSKVEIGEQELYVTVERGMVEGERIVFKSGADEQPDMSAGDLVFKIKTVPHRHFRRDGDDLHLRVPLTLVEALTGFSKSINHLDGHPVALSRSQVTPHGFVLEIENEGMPVHNFPSQKGNLFVEFVVKIWFLVFLFSALLTGQFPDDLSEQQKETVRNMGLKFS